MRSKLIRKVVGAGLALGMTFGVSQAANAAYNLSSGYIDTSGALTGTISQASSNFSESGVYAGRIALAGTTDSGANFSFESFCVDIKDWLTAGTYYTAGLAALGIGDTKTSQLTALLSHVDTYIAGTSGSTDTKAERSAAAQLAIWEIVDESTSNAYNLASGNFTASGYDATALGDAADLLTKVGNGTTGAWKTDSGMSFTLLQSTGRQTQVIYGAAGSVPSVPEPATWGMMVLGFGALGSALRRKQAGRHAIA